MGATIVPKRFGLKYSPKPAIALEFETTTAASDPELAILEVYLEQLSPSTCDVEGVVHALQKTYPRHLGADVVSVAQLERLVTRLLENGKPHLPEYYSRGSEVTREEVHEVSADVFLPAKPHTPGAEICGNNDFEDSDYLSKKSTPAPSPGGQESGAIFRTTRDTQVPIDMALILLDEARAIHRQKDGDEALEETATPIFNEEAGRKIDTRSILGVSEGKTSALDKQGQSKETSATQKEKQSGVDQSENHVEYAGAIENEHSNLVSKLDNYLYLENKESGLEEGIPGHNHGSEKFPGGFDNFEDGEETHEGGAIGVNDVRSSGTKEGGVANTLDASDEKGARAVTEELQAAASVCSAFRDAPDDEGDVPQDTTRLHVAVRPGNEIEGTPRSSVNNSVGDQEKSKSLKDVPDTDENRREGSYYDEASALGTGSQGSDFPLVLPTPPPPTLSVADALSDKESFSTALSYFAKSSGSSEQPLSSTGGLSVLSLAGTPLPPVVGARQRLDLLGCLPHGGGRGLLIQGGTGRAAPDEKPAKTDIMQQSSFPRSSEFLSSGARPVASSPPESHRLSNTSTRQCTESSEDDERGAPDERLREEDRPKEDGEEKDLDGRISPPESPKQHQGQEEENAGRIVESEVDDEPVRVMGERTHNDGGECDRREVDESFTHSDVEGEIEEEVIGDGNSIDESIQIEQESDLDDGYRKGDVDGDFFS